VTAGRTGEAWQADYNTVRVNSTPAGMALANFRARPRHGHMENARSYLRPGNIRSVKEQVERGAEEAAKSGLLSKGQSAGEAPAERSEFQASGH
jgi:hypothetical protein